MKPVHGEKTQIHIETPVGNLLLDNPMAGESGRMARKLVGAHLPPVTRNTMLAVLAVLYFGAVLLALVYRSALDPAVMIVLQTLTLCLVLPSVMNGSIVNEREKRSWDMILVAPVTPAQIVAGKLLSGLFAAGGIIALFIPFTLASLLSGTSHNLASILLAEFVSTSFGITLVSFCLSASAKAKRLLHAQATTYGVQTAAMLVWPALTGLVSTGAEAIFFLNFFNPFFLIATLIAPNFGSPLGLGTVQGAAWLALLLYLGITAFCIRRAHAWVKLDRHTGL